MFKETWSDKQRNKDRDSNREKEFFIKYKNISRQQMQILVEDMLAHCHRGCSQVNFRILIFPYGEIAIIEKILCLLNTESSLSKYIGVHPILDAYIDENFKGTPKGLHDLIVRADNDWVETFIKQYGNVSERKGTIFTITVCR